MKLPAGMNEQEVLDIINHISRRLAHIFKFGYHDIEDMRQQAALYALEGLDNYDGCRPLANFLWVHVRNRLFNLKRDKYARPENPCANCTKQCKYANEEDCPHYKKWVARNLVKRGIMRPVNIQGESESLAATESKEYDKETLERINTFLPVKYRKDFLKLLHGEKLLKAKLDKLREVIMEILQDE